MNILVIGSGGREHAICWSFARSSKVRRIFCAPGNAGIAAVAECVAIGADDIESLAKFASSSSIDLTFVGGESPLALGIVDDFESRGLKIIGPTKSASRLEASKAFAKDFMHRHSVPTARYSVASSPEAAQAALASGEFGGTESPAVVKADGLAAGKGVIVANNRQEALDSVAGLGGLVGGEAASQIVVEECLRGKEVSLIMFASGEDFALMPPTRDHKRIGEGDTGPNTGGMGTFTDDDLLPAEQLDEIKETIIRPTLRGCVEEGFPFRGILFLGLMMTADGPRVLEYNVRFGDPETQSILVRLESDIVDICKAMLAGELREVDIKWKVGNSATVVLAARGYPQSPQKGDVIQGIDEAARVPGVSVFHAGTIATENGDLVTAGGRVLGVTAVGETLPSALGSAYKAVEKIWWDGMQFRRDIGK